MKNIVTSLLLGLIAISFVSCDDNDLKYNGPSLVMFPAGTSGTYYIAEKDTKPYTISLGFTVASSVDRTVKLNVTSNSAVSGVDYTMPTAVVVKAGEYVADFQIAGIYAGVADGVKDTLSIKIDDPDIAQFNTTYTVVLSKFCPFDPSEFVGTWIATYYDKTGAAVNYSQEIQINWSAALGDTLELINFHSDYDKGYFNPTTLKIVANYSDPANFNMVMVDQDGATNYGGVKDLWIKQATGKISPFSSCDKTMTLYYDPYFPKSPNTWLGSHSFRATLVKK